MVPILPLWKVIAYIVGITTGITGELIEELFYVILRLKYYKSESKQFENPIILKVGMNHHSTPPLPQRYMILCGVQLFQSFVGWCEKITGRIPTFSDKIHRIGTHKVLLVTLLASHCVAATNTAFFRPKGV